MAQSKTSTDMILDDMLVYIPIGLIATGHGDGEGGPRVIRGSHFVYLGHPVSRSKRGL